MKHIKSDFLPDYCVRASERSFFTQLALDALAILVWIVLGVAAMSVIGSLLLLPFFLYVGII